MHRLLQVAVILCMSVSVKPAVVHSFEDLEEDDASLYVKLSRDKRSTSCPAKYQVFTSSHTACLPGSASSVVSTTDQDVIVARHNQHRAAVSPSATNMLKMKWDDELAMIAQKWAEQCIGGHDQNINRRIPGRFGVGQNVATNAQSWTEVVDLWHDEVKTFTYGDPNYTFASIGHYTQVVWATTTLVGCGVFRCNGMNSHICNYGPAGNLGGSIQTPYKNGTACSSCSNHCVDSTLCDCNSLACKNGGTIDVTACACTCQPSAPLYMYKQPDCTLNCSGTDAGFCTDSNTCPGYADWCPHMCKVCPYAEDGYVGTSPDGSGSRKVVSGAVFFLSVALQRLLC